MPLPSCWLAAETLIASGKPYLSRWILMPGDLSDRQRRRRRTQHLEHQPGQFARLEPAVGPTHRPWQDRRRFELGGEQPQHGVNMQKISPMLADPLLQIGDTAGQLGPLVLQRRDNIWFGHNPYPLEKMRLCSSSWAFLASRSWWRLLHKTANMRHYGA